MKNWNPKANDIFARALELDTDSKRFAFVERECRDDSGLLDRVREMLRSHDDAGSFLVQPAIDLDLPLKGHRSTGPVQETVQSGSADLNGAARKARIDPETLSGNQDPTRRDRSANQPNFGDYELLEEIARGGMGVVYRARQTRLNRIVALKMILTGVLASDQEVRRFQAEAKAVAGLEHVGIVPLYEVGQFEGHHFFSMGFVGGGCLSDRLVHGPLELREAAILVQRIAEAVAYAHDLGIIHRDLKPTNVLLDSAGQPKIADFGLSRRMDSDDGMTKTGQILGTPGFMAPEQASGNIRNVTTSVDIYAVGAILYSLITGRPPFGGTSTIETLKQVIDREPVAPHLLNASIDRDLETVCLKCLEKEPARRFRSAREIADELKRYLAGIPVQARPVGRATRVWKWCKRNPGVASLAVAAVFFLAAGTLVSLFFAIRARTSAMQAELGEAEARSLLVQVQRQSEASRRQLYNAQMNVCGISVESDGGIGLIQRYLANWNSETGQPDLRGWEWSFFDSYAHRASQNIRLDGQGFALDWSPNGEFLAVAGSHDIKILDRKERVVNVLDGHDHLVRSVQWDPAGKRLASGCHAGTLIIWEDPVRASSHRKLPCIRKPVLSLAWRHDGEILAALIEFGNRVELWEPRTSGEPVVIRGSGTQLQFSPVDNRLACGCGPDLRIWRVDDIQNPVHIATLDGENALAKGVAWSPGGQHVAAGFFNGDIKLWDLATDNVKVLQGHTDSVFNLSWSNDGRKFVSGSFDYTLRIWDANDGRQTEALRGHTDRVFSAQYSPDGLRIASTGEDGFVRFWQPSDGAIRQFLNRGKVEIPGSGDHWCLAWNPATKSLATSGNEETTIRDYRTGEEKVIAGAHFCWRRDGKLAAFGQLNRVSFRNAETNIVENELTIPNQDEGSQVRIRCMAWDHAGNQIAVICRGSIAGENRTLVYVCSPELSDVQLVADFENDALCGSWSPDGKKLAFGCSYGVVRIWDKSENEIRSSTIPVANEEIHSIRWSPSGRRLAMGCGDHTVRIRNFDDGSITALRGHTFPVWDVAWHPFEERLASASGDRSVRIWDTRNAGLVTTLKLDAPGRAVAWHPDGRRLAAFSSLGTVRVWDAAKNNSLPLSSSQ